MRVKCIYNGNWPSLTIDKTYDAIREDGVCYEIINGKGKEYWFPKRWFKTLTDIRNKTIDKLLAE